MVAAIGRSTTGGFGPGTLMMSSLALPYEQIRQVGDRAWSQRLLARVTDVDLSDAEDEELVGTLAALSDPRSVPALVALLGDRSAHAIVRERASAILLRLVWGGDASTEQLLAWWAAPDVILRRHALSCMSGDQCAEIVSRIAADPTHPLQALAITRMHHGFDTPEYEAIKIRALGQPEPEVRCAAATALLWDEPVAAEAALLDALRDREPCVVAAAAGTLRYYPTRRAFSAIFDLRRNCPESLIADVEEAYRDLRTSFLQPLLASTPKVREHVSRWLEPISHLLTFTPEELEPGADRPESVAEPAPRQPRSADWIVRRLADPDMSIDERQALFRGTEWASCEMKDRAALRACFLRHDDVLVREGSTEVFRRWGDVDALVTLLDDGAYLVRKSAMYALGQLPPDSGIAHLAWTYFHERRIRGTHALEALACHVHHARDHDVNSRLFELASSTTEAENIRAQSIGHLMQHGALRELELILPRLGEPPAVTWAFHLALLEAAAKCRLTVPNLAALADVDNLYIQQALGEL